MALRQEARSPAILDPRHSREGGARVDPHVNCFIPRRTHARRIRGRKALTSSVGPAETAKSRPLYDRDMTKLQTLYYFAPFDSIHRRRSIRRSLLPLRTPPDARVSGILSVTPTVSTRFGRSSMAAFDWMEDRWGSVDSTLRSVVRILVHCY